MNAAERRLAKVEGALSPRAATLLWLEEAQQFRSIPAYADWLIDQLISAAPLERVPEQARAAALEATRGLPREVVREANHQAVRDAVFLVELVLRLNSVAEEAIRIEGLRYAAFFWEMRALTAEAELERRKRSHADRSASNLAERWPAWRASAAALLTRIYAAEEARALLERRYLDGHPALFPDAIKGSARLRSSVEGLASLGGTLPLPPVGRRPAARSAEIEPPYLDRDALRSGARAEAPALAARLVDDARAKTLDVLGDAEGAASIAARRLPACAEVLLAVVAATDAVGARP